ncbi:hypothetical protein [Nostoc sp. FACHB-110]|uniref:hypothetical protein n=1 Tax=Nostoc sp. FACHB-110 TaxID=2692834 RepID=UPI001682FD50|nr:hypothetical protein [Nostoc sp. FACHB-110]MBD2440980.1 hypothetical protein [Nostoc sp. FACHB-110]
MNDKQKELLDSGRIISGSLAVIAITIVIQLLQSQSLSSYLTFALFCFATSIPLLVFCFSKFSIVPQTKDIRPIYGILLIASSLITIIGLCLIFFHLNIIAGGLFTLISIIVIIFEMKA